MFENMTLEELNKAISKAIPQLTITTDPLSETPTITATVNNINPTLWDCKPIQQEIKIPMNDEQFENAKRVFDAEYRALYRKKIARVIFNEPATIVFWDNATKTVSKCYDEEYDKKKGLLMCIAKAHGCTHSHIKAVLKCRGLKGSQDAELCLLYDIADRNGYYASDIDNIVEKYTREEDKK